MGAASLARLWLPAGFRGSVALGMLPPLLLGGLFASGLAAETPAYVQMRRERRRSAEEEGGQLAAPGATQPSAASAPATAPAASAMRRAPGPARQPFVRKWAPKPQLACGQFLI